MTAPDGSSRAPRERPASVAVGVLVVMCTWSCSPAASPCDGGPCAPATRFAAGTTPNDVVLSSCDGRPVALVADSAEAALHAIDLRSGDVVSRTLFPPIAGDNGDRFASPWSVAASQNGERAAVTLFGQDRVAWVDPCSGRLLHVAHVDGATTPQPVVLAGERVVVAYPNIRRFGFDGAAPELDAGEVVSFVVEDDVLVLHARRTLPCLNPQGLSVDRSDVVVSCSGPLTRGSDGGQEAIADGALVRLDIETLTLGPVMDAGRLAPGTPSVVGERIIVGSLVDPRVCVAPLGAAVLEDCITLEGPAVDAIFEVAKWSETTLLATQFSRDALQVLEFTADGLHPTGEVPVGPGGTAFRGLLAVDVKPGASPDAVGLLGLSAEVVPLDLAEVLP